MKSTRFLFFCIVSLFLILQVSTYSSSSGVTNATRKYGPNGCGCHGGTYTSADAGVKVVIKGPDSLLVGGTAIYTVTVSGGSALRSGINIAVSSGTLSTNGSTILKLTNAELTHKSPVTYTDGSVVYTFQYKAPNSVDSVIMYAAGSSSKAWNFADDKVIHVVRETAVVQESGISRNLYILQNYPNPFNPATRIFYSVAADSRVTLSVYSVSGKLVSVLCQSQFRAGSYTAVFNGSALPSGIYLCKLEAHEVNSGKTFEKVCKIVLTK
jgi:hypothetical protein